MPVFSSSSLRYGKSTQAARNGSIGKVLRAETFSPCPLEKTHPDLFWYGVHGVESSVHVVMSLAICIASCQSVFPETRLDSGCEAYSLRSRLRLALP